MFARRVLGRSTPTSSCLRWNVSTEADIEQARKYCVDQLRYGDYEAYLIRRFVPPTSRDTYDAVRTLNLELVRLPETVSNPSIGRMRARFWHDAVSSVFTLGVAPPREPISILLRHALTDLAARTGSPSAATAAGATTTNRPAAVARRLSSSIKFWLLRLVAMRERRLDDRPFPTLADLEACAEHTYAGLMYATLAAAPLRSLHVDHIASHIAKACGIVAMLRGIPVLAGRSSASSPSPSPAVGFAPTLLLPLDIMAESGLKEEEFFRKGATEAAGFQDAVFKVATRANDHLITAREMMAKLRAGEGPGHDFEHEGEGAHVYLSRSENKEGIAADINQAFGVLLEAVPASDYLSSLEAAEFDPFKVGKSWKVPWKMLRALGRREI